MKEYEVVVRAIVTKTMIVEASDEREAEEFAHERFTVLPDNTPEDYDQETIGQIEEVIK